MLTKSQKIVITAWVCSVAALTVLILFQAVNMEYFIILNLISILIIAELSGPFLSRPSWKLRLNFALVLGALLFILIVIEKALSIINK
jgi:hypothetical protein